MVEKLVQAPGLDSTEVSAYFYCSRTTNDSRLQDPKAILLSVLRQRAAPLPGLAIKAPIVSVYSREMSRGSHRADLTIDEITSLLTDLIQQCYEKVTLVLDALDECDTRGRLQLLETFTKLTYNNTKTIVKTLISSRQDPDIESHFKKTPNVWITATDNAADISEYVSKEVGKRLLRGKANRDLRDRVEKELNAKANGVFRWVALQIDALCDPDRVYSQEDVEYLLPRLPETLGDTYSKILSDTDRLPPHGRHMLRSIIKLLICAIYPMRYEVIHEAVHILSGAQVPPFSKGFVRNILKMGRGLIVGENRWPLFIFAHLSVKEFFESRPDFNSEHAHALAAEACLSLYFRADFEERPVRTFRSYAVQNLGKHCQKAGALRRSPKLRLLLKNFLLEYGSNNASELWNQDGLSKDVGEGYHWPQEHENPHCHSEPALSLFIVCVYGLEEFVEPLILHKQKILRAENSMGYRPLEVATIYEYYDIVIALYEAATLARKSPVRGKEWIKIAAQCKDLKLWSFVVDHTPNENLKSAIESVARNSTLGMVMIPRILGSITELDARTLEAFLGDCTSLAMVDMVLNHPAGTTMTTSMLEAAVQNQSINPELTSLILSMAPYLRVTGLCFVLAFYGKHLSDSRSSFLDGVIKNLLSHHSRSEITEEVVCKAIDFSSKDEVGCLEQLLNHSLLDCISEDMLSAVLASANIEILTYFLDHPRAAKISQQIVQRAISQTEYYPNPVISTLLTRPGCPPVSEESLYATSEMDDWEHEKTITMEQCRLIQITDAYIQACAANRSSYDFEYVFNLPRAIPLSESAVYASFENASYGSEILGFLLPNKPGFRMDISEDVLVRAVSHCCAYDLVLMLADHWGTLPVTKRSIMAAAKRRELFFKRDLVDLLLQHSTSDATMLTDDILVAAINGNNLGFVQYFMLRKPDFEIKEKHLEAALQPITFGSKDILRFLLSRKGDLPISVTLLETAAREEDKAVLELLMEQEGAPRPLPELSDLLKQEPSEPLEQQNVTFDDLLSAASKRCMPETHYPTGFELSTTRLDDVLSKYDGPPINSSLLVEVAAERDDGKFVVQYILTRYPETTITQCALLAAARNEKALTTLLELLLERSHLEVSVELLKQAVGNKVRGTSMLELLLSKYPGVGELGSDIIVTALKNPYCGRSIFQIILRRQPQLAITQDLIDAASENVVMAGVLLQTFLKRALDLRVTGSVDLIYRKLENTEHGLRDSLFMAACYGDDMILKYLISQGISLNTVSGELGTALNVAIYADQTNIVKILLEHGSDPNSYSHFYGTALQIACRKGQTAIIRALAEHDVDIDRPDNMGRTVLHTAARVGNSDVVRALITQKASLTPKDYQGMTALHHASACTKSANGLDTLIKSGASLVDEGDSAQWTPLHWAAYANATSAVARLVEAGASKSRLTVCGKTPSQIARFRGHFHLLPKLLSADDDSDDEGPMCEVHDGIICDACDLVCLESISRFAEVLQ